MGEPITCSDFQNFYRAVKGAKNCAAGGLLKVRYVVVGLGFRQIHDQARYHGL